MNEFILFIFSFLFILAIYEFIIVRRAKRGKEKSGKKKTVEPVEIDYLVHRYHLDLKKVNYNHLLQVVAFTSSFDIALIVSIILLFHNFLLEILLGFISTIVIILISYHIVYLFYKKGGMIKDES